jgi:hypothetical protein
MCISFVCEALDVETAETLYIFETKDCRPYLERGAFEHDGQRFRVLAAVNTGALEFQLFCEQAPELDIVTAA